MKNLLTSAVLTVAAVPFLMASPAPKKAQAGSDQTQGAPAKTKKSKKHSKKASNASAASANSSAPAK